MARSTQSRPPGELGAALRRLEPPARRAHLLERLCREVATFLDVAAEDVDPRTGFVALGFDSLRAVDFRGRLEQLLGTELRSTLLFDQPDCERLTDFLLAELGESLLTRAPASLRADRPAAPHASAEVAIVGMACRFPGPARDLRAFWELLAASESAIGEPPEGRWPLDELYDPDPSVPGRIYTRRGGFLPAIEQFDAAFFGIPPVEATMLDPQQRLLLEVAWETLEDAGVPPQRLQELAAGVFVGMRASEYFQSQCARLPEDADAWYATGNAVSTAAGRLSYFLGFRGPCFALDTACSGSLVAVHEAVQSLRIGECRAALAGGVNTLIDPLSSVGLCRARMLAADGQCKTFDARADGYVRAEGCGMVLLMRLEDARALGLPVRAVIRGSAINQDGRTGGLTVPHGPSQEAVVRAALRDAGLGADDIDYLEAHGTGTALGDPIEVAALDAVFAGRRSRGRPLWVGSVKTNVGHLEAAAGISGLIKVVLALQHEQLPAHRNFEQPNPHIAWDHTEIEVVRRAQPWPRGERRRRAGVSSFGFSGTNAHVVLEEGDPPLPQSPARQHQAVVLSAATVPALRQQALRWAEAAVAPEAPPLCDVAFTAGHGRTHFAHRLGVVAGDANELQNALRSYADGAPAGVIAGHAARTPPRVAFLFSGQGSQRPGAGRELYDEEPVFRAAIDRCARVFDRLRDAPLTEVLFGEDAERLRRTDYTQPAMFALQFALAELWRSFGVEPVCVLGHSIGEIAAAAAAGVFSPEDGLRMCAARGALMVQHCRRGAMLAVFADEARVRGLLAEDAAAAAGRNGADPDCVLAAVNGPAETVLSGAPAAVERLARRCDAAALRTQRLAVSHAFHSPLMAPMIAPFRRRLLRMNLLRPRLPLLSCRSDPEADPAAAEHWVRHVEQPVHFAAALAAAASRADVLVEIGPTPVLLGLAARSLPRPLPAVPSLRAGKPERAQMLRGAVQLHVLGGAVNFAALTRADAPRRVAMPTYPFERQRFWLRHRAAPMRSAVHPLLGARLPTLLLGPHQRLFEGTLAERSPPWLADHRVYDRALFPAAGLVECALAAAAQAHGQERLELRDVAITAPLWLDAQPVTTQVLLDGEAEGAQFKICRRAEDAWPVHATGAARALSQGTAPPVPPEAAGAELLPAQLYEEYLSAGLHYGPSFRAVLAARRGDGAASGRIALPPELRAEAAAFVVHPVLLDACFQVAGAAIEDRAGGAVWLPVGIERLRVLRRPGAEGACRARLRPVASERTRVLDLVLLDAEGTPALAVEGLQLLRSAAHVLAAVDSTRWLHTVHWQRRPRPAAVAAAGPSGNWCISAPTVRAETHALATQLAAAGTPARVVPLDDLPAAVADGCRGVVFDATAAVPGSSEAIAALLAALARCVRAAAAGVPPPRFCAVTADAVAADVLDAVDSTPGAAVWGFLRSVALEHPELQPRCVDRDARTGLDLVARELLAGDDEDLVALRSEQRFVPRLVAGTRRPGELHLPPGSFRLRSQEYGRLDRLAAIAVEPPAPGPGEILVEVAAAGLNFKDVLHALGLLRQWSEAEGIHGAAAQPLGLECAGTVAALGPGVAGPPVGTRVAAVAGDAFADRVVVPAAHAIALPGGVDPVLAAGVPTVFATALHALEDLAAVGPGDRVLIHAAAGGVGLAALQVCRRRGCTVFATSSPGKAAFLRAHGVEHWADSRGNDFDEVLRAAGGGGVDVVLNSLTGDAIGRSLALLREGGRFVEIGKRGIWSAERMAAARPDVRYWNFDLADEARREPALLARLLGRVREGLADGSLRPVSTTVVPIQRAPEVFAAMAKGRHTGKLVLTLPRQVGIRGDRTYLITGGTGAVGSAVAAALVEQGARHVALIARRAAVPPAVEELRARANVRVFAADVADAETLALAVRDLRAAMPPMAGVVHAAGGLHDALLRDLDEEGVRSVLRPKVDGVRYLTALLDERHLEFLVTTSSMAAWLGNQSQTAYAAANAWLDAFCANRAARGRTALSVAFGPWAEAGMAARLGAAQRARLRDLGIDSIPPAVGATLLLRLLGSPAANPGVLPVRWQSFVRQFAGRVPPLLRGLGTAASAGDGTAPAAATGTLAARLLPLPAAARAELLRGHLRGELARVLGFANADELDPARTFGELGIDSLLAVEIRTQLGRALALPLPATLLFDHPDLERLAAHLLALLPAPPAGAAEAGPGEAGAAGADVLPTAPDGDEEALPDDDRELARALERQVRMMEERP